MGRRGMLRIGGMAAAGAAGVAISGVLDAPPAAADDGDAVLQGTDNVGATVRTAIIQTNENNETIGAFNDASRGAAVRGRAGADSGDWPVVSSWSTGVFGESGEIEGKGVWGVAPHGDGVRGLGGFGVVGLGGVGVLGSSDAPDGIGVRGASTTGHALHAETTSTSTKPAAKIVSGAAAQPAIQANGATMNTIAVQANGRTIVGTGSTAVGPAFKSTSGAAVQPAIKALGTDAGTGYAADLRGKVTFNRSGVLEIAAGQTQAATLAVPGGLSSTSYVLATVQNNLGASTPLVRAAVPNTGTGTITVYLSAAVPSSQTLRLAWFVVG